MCLGLHFLHTRCQIIHTDLKPENVLLTQHIPPFPKAKAVKSAPSSPAKVCLTFGDVAVLDVRGPRGVNVLSVSHLPDSLRLVPATRPPAQLTAMMMAMVATASGPQMS